MVICSRNNGIVMANCFRFIYWKCYKCCCGISTSQRHISESFELLIAIFIYAFLAFTGPKMFLANPIFLCQTKNLFTYLCIVAVTNILCQTKRWLAFSKIGFCGSTKVFEEALNAVKFLGWLKKIWTGTKHFGTCKRTRQKFLLFRGTFFSFLAVLHPNGP